MSFIASMLLLIAGIEVLRIRRGFKKDLKINHPSRETTLSDKFEQPSTPTLIKTANKDRYKNLKRRENKNASATASSQNSADLQSSLTSLYIFENEMTNDHCRRSPSPDHSIHKNYSHNQTYTHSHPIHNEDDYSGDNSYHSSNYTNSVSDNNHNSSSSYDSGASSFD
ncbi:hypothetical protein AAGG74_15470 [Bacillus mexicanus]|uniref:hypothetical protein n=1 Tax=Bacillus mexicanus TaxID=2834415 RepID=UPI003D1EA5D0